MGSRRRPVRAGPLHIGREDARRAGDRPEGVVADGSLPGRGPRGSFPATRYVAGSSVTLILASRPNVYTGSPLLRAAHKREDAAWIAAALASPEALFVPVWRSRNLMDGVAEGKPEAVLLPAQPGGRLARMAGRTARPGLSSASREPQPVFALDVSAAEDPQPLLPAGAGTFTDLRAVAGALPAAGRLDAGACARPDALAQPPSLLRGVRRPLRGQQRRPRHALLGLRQQPFPPHRPRRDHAGAPRRERAARPLPSVSQHQHVFHACGLRGAGRESGGSGQARGGGGIRHARGPACTTTAASPGRFRPASCWGSMARRCPRRSPSIRPK